MLFPVQQLLDGKEPLVVVKRDDKVRDALALMVEHDFSQLPIVDAAGNLLSMITEQSIISTYFHTSGAVSMLDLSVDNCQTKPFTLAQDRDIFEALDMLESAYAIVIVDDRRPKGIFTAYDATHFFRDLSEGLILVEDIEVTLREYIESVFPEGQPRQAALLKAFRPDRQDPTKPGKEYEELSFGDHVQLIATEQNWERFSAYLQPKEMFLQLMNQVGQIRNQLAHFRGRIEPVQYDALLRARDWLLSRPRLASRGTKEIRRDEIQGSKLKSDSKYGPLQAWLQQQKEAGETSISINMSDIAEMLQDVLPPSAFTHRSWWANDFTTHTQARAWLSTGWLVSDVDLDSDEVIFRQSMSALYPEFFTAMLDALKAQRPGVTQVTRVFVQNWIGLSAGRTGYSFVWSLPREGVGGGALRVELDIDTGDKTKNKEAFDALRVYEKEIESKIGFSLDWERLDNNKMSRVTASMPFRLATASPQDVQRAQAWGVDTMLKFIDMLGPYVKNF